MKDNNDIDFYLKPSPDTYDTGRFFYMPTRNGPVWAIAFDIEYAVMIMAAYNVLIGLIFLIGWKIITYLVAAAFVTDNNPNRYVGLVAFLNSAESITAVPKMIAYCWRMRKTENTWKGTWGGLMLLGLSTAVAVGGIIGGILIPNNLLIGSVAPVRPAAIFFPDNNMTYNNKLQQYYERPQFWALGLATSEESNFNSLVGFRWHLRGEVSGDPSANENQLAFQYNYTLTVLDFGLQKAPDLVHSVSGECWTEYRWYNASMESTEDREIYSLWFEGNSKLITYTLSHKQGSIVDFRVKDPVSPDDDFSEETVAYVILFGTAGRRIWSRSKNPLIFTEDHRHKVLNFLPDLYMIKTGRPILSCWQKTSWEMNGQTVGTRHLNQLSSLNDTVSSFTKDTVIPAYFKSPSLIQMHGILSSQVFISNFKFDEDGVFSSTDNFAQNDISRLIRASYVSSRNFLVDMIRAPPEPSPFRGNITEDDRASFASAGFVLATRDVSTLSATVLIAVPSVLLFLSFILLSLEVKMRLAVTKDSSDESSHKGRPLKDTFISRLRYLEATQLYRFLNDSNCKQVDYDLQWRPVLNKPELELRTPYCLGTSHPGLLPLSDIDDNNERSESKTGFGYTQLEKTASENALSMDMVANTIPEDERPLIETLIRIKMQNRAFNSV